MKHFQNSWYTSFIVGLRYVVSKVNENDWSTNGRIGYTYRMGTIPHVILRLFSDPRKFVHYHCTFSIFIFIILQ